MTTKTLATADLAGLAADLIAAGVRVAAPVRLPDQEVEYRWLKDWKDTALDGRLPRRSLKQFFLPATEPLFAWVRTKDGVRLHDAPTTFPASVVLGARPCDAAAVDALDRVMGWDYKDEPWFARRQATTIVSVDCAGGDGSCFCTAVGLGPDSGKGSDVLLHPVASGWVAEVLTDKGKALADRFPARFKDGGDAAGADGFRKAARDKVAGNLSVDPAKVRAWVEAHFEDPLWADLGLRCHGCGACASVCPTCHCFDIVDEPEGIGTGVRRRNWDTCQTSVFTVHASGHNPRNDQGARFRQRVNHKFAIYPAKFGEVLCTGCGRCARACPGGQDLPEVLAKIAAL